jgi:hypothetical protein
MMILKLMLISMVALVIIMGWIVVIATDRYIDKQIKNNHEDIPEILAGSEMPKEMVDAMVDKPKRGRPKKNG